MVAELCVRFEHCFADSLTTSLVLETSIAGAVGFRGRPLFFLAVSEFNISARAIAELVVGAI